MTAAQFNCDDFGTANPDHLTGRYTAATWRVADSIGLPSPDAAKFTQGFIHACQDRSDLVGTGSATYDAGHACGMVSAARFTFTA